VRLIAVVFLVVLAAMVSACTKTSDKGLQGSEKSNLKEREQPFIFSEAENFNFIDVIKRKTLPEYPTIPIGTAFDSFPFFVKKEWKDIRGRNGTVYIDFIGWFDAKKSATSATSDVSAEGLAAKFVIRRDSTYGLVMMSRLEARADGSVTAYPLEDFKGVLEQLYGKKEIRF
jgi:hypothetical protein